MEAFISAKDLIAQSADVEVSLSAVVDDALHAADTHRVVVEPGPSIQLSHADVRPIRMILHELMTNAMKYGALSRPDGLVHLGWRVIGDDEPQNLQIDWREERGPAVSLPDHRGFGINLIESCAKNRGGKANLRFEPDGLRVEILIPMGH